MILLLTVKLNLLSDLVEDARSGRRKSRETSAILVGIVPEYNDRERVADDEINPGIKTDNALVQIANRACR